ncbi:hypothetical protein BC6307_18010 [Sutcliffiella cohnii]|uniref:NERD domain-containing protein n=1 Tax=Sutcliffiella cohnii TaxID=33932 RepID=A0A223KUI0_9BACI|nr:nuclease-related domain-containing protein [Sutcliffiella cohnii]AST93017.1 hypothetical protein BC6307_18010 [Sutcliffiella cohnii]
MDILLLVLLLLVSLYCIKLYKDSLKTREINKAFEQVSATLEAESIEKSRLANEVNNLSNKNEEFEHVILRQQEELESSKNYLKYLHNKLQNRGEFITSQIMYEIKESLIRENLINTNDIFILENVYIYNSKKERNNVRQIDHLILIPTGVYVIETKYWRGKIIHGISKEKNKEYLPILESMFPESKKEAEQTIVLTNEEKNKVSISSYDNPATQVAKTAIDLKKIIDLNLNKKVLVQGIVYFGYPTDNENYVLNYTSKSDGIYPKIFISKDDIEGFFINELSNRKKVFTNDELARINNIIENINR